MTAPSTGSGAASNTLRIPDEMISAVISFDPDALRVLRVVSRSLRHAGENYLQLNTERILAFWPERTSPLYFQIYSNLIRFSIRLRSLPDQFNIQFHLSIPEVVRSLDVPAMDCPDRILTSQEISRFNRQVQQIQDANLERIWNRVRLRILAIHPIPQDIPIFDASPQQSRAWMQANPTVLQSLTTLNLQGLQLTGVPLEMGLCGGLRKFQLSNNRLISLSTGLFRKMARLHLLQLSNNQLASLPGSLFHGLTRLQGLYLSNNHLTSLPEDLFRGLGSLQWLHLSHNRLTSLPGSLFHGLARLQTLYLSYNQLGSLPEDLFHGLAMLEEVQLFNNQLFSVPANLFQGLTQLQTLYLSHNQLASLPEGLFHGLPMLQWLYLSHNRLVFVPVSLFHGLDRLQALSLSGNPHLLISFQDVPEDHMQFREMAQTFSSYTCQSPLASLYQLAANGASLEALGESLSALPPNMRNTLFGLVWEEAGRPLTGDHQWGEHHVFDDMPIFGRALKKYVKERFESLTHDQKNLVDYHVYDLARNQQGAETISFDIPNWGELHALDNLPRLIDAMWRAGALYTRSDSRIGCQGASKPRD